MKTNRWECRHPSINSTNPALKLERDRKDFQNCKKAAKEQQENSRKPIKIEMRENEKNADTKYQQKTRRKKQRNTTIWFKK